jgi:hypothetical protein
MGAPEIGWRARSLARVAIDRAGLIAKGPQWNRRDLASALADNPGLAATRSALAAERWDDAHARLSRYFLDQPARFVIGPAVRPALVRRLRSAWPYSARAAAARGDRIIAGEFDLLGYQGLRFSSPHEARIDWHWDPVHRRRMPEVFWATVGYLDPAFGDHKIVWELNRHQHWIALARAFWLTDDEKYREAFLAQLASWLAANPPLVGSNWASMLELAFRALSWTWALNSFVTEQTIGDDDTAPWTVDLLLALDRQLTHVERNLSFYFSPNTHLLGEALALYVTGRALPLFGASARRESIGRDVLVSEIGRQITADGSHRERSSHYHRYTLDFYLLALAIAQITNDPVAPVFAEVSSRLADATRILADEHERLPHFGDDDGGVLLPICGRPLDDVGGSLAVADALLGRQRDGDVAEEVYWIVPGFVIRDSGFVKHREHREHRGHRDTETQRRSEVGTRKTGPAARRCDARQGSAALRDMGYFVSRSRGGIHVVMHAGPHGYLNGGHAHADALSLTVSLRGRPFLIDSGTGCYTVDAETRERFRSTAFHNTLVLDGRSQSLPDGPFHWARSATSSARIWQSDATSDYFAGVHDGYHPVEHHRHVLSVHDDLLIVADLVDGSGGHAAATYWHLHPRWSVRLAGRRAALSCDDRRVDLVIPYGVLEHFAGDKVTGLGWHSPVYGRIEAGSTLRISHDGAAPMWMAAVFGFDPDNEVADVESVPVERKSGVDRTEYVLRVSRMRSSNDFGFGAD